MEEGMHDALPTDDANLSLRKMGDYQTTRLLVGRASDRIWPRTQWLEDLDWFGPEMPYVQYGGGSLLVLLELGAHEGEGDGELQLKE